MRPTPSRLTESARLTESERESLCSEVARQVMGWASSEIPWAYDGMTSMWHTEDGDPVMTVFSWRPDRNDVQNMQVLDRMSELGFELRLTVRGDGTVARFSLGTEWGAHGEHRDRRIALLRAALDAAGSPPTARRAGGDAAE